MIELNKRMKTEKFVFKMNHVLSSSMKMLFGSEPEPSYNERLRRTAMRIVQGDSDPLVCADCGLENELVLELHHEFDSGSNVTGNYLRSNKHSSGAAQYRYIIKNGPKNENFTWVLVCGNCHTLRHRKNGRNHEFFSNNYQQDKVGE